MLYPLSYQGLKRLCCVTMTIRESVAAYLQSDPHRARSARAQAGRRKWEAKRLPRAQAALEAARRDGYGPATPPGDRGPVIVRLQDAGCYLQEIGDLFGVHRVRVMRQGAAYRKSRPVPEDPSVPSDGFEPPASPLSRERSSHLS